MFVCSLYYFAVGFVGFPGCVGCVDGTEVRITPPASNTVVMLLAGV